MIEDGASHFEDFDGLVYLNCANHGPLPKVTAEAVHDAVSLKTHPNRIPDSIYFTLTERARRAVAPFAGAAPETVTLGAGESHGAALAALGFPWREGDEVVVASSDFPANVYIWCNAARRNRGVARVVQPRRRAAVTEEILEAIEPATRIVAVSLVDFGSGQVMDIERLGRRCAESGIMFVVDATQAAGVVPIDMSAARVSVLTVAGYKWMLAPYGTGFAAISPEWMDRIEPTYITWTAAEGAEKFNALPREDWTWHPSARRFDAPETASFLNVTGLARSAEFIAELGRDRVYRHVIGLLERLEKELPAGYRRRAAPGVHPGPILSLETEDMERAARAHRALTDAGIVTSLREDGIRVSPYIYNRDADFDRLLTILGDTR